MCIYSPNDETERKKFLGTLPSYLHGNKRIIMGGDYNFVENISLDKIGSNPTFGDTGVFHLIDCFRQKHPNVKEYTWHSNTVHCRLDRFYVDNELITWVENIYHSPCTLSDHDFVELIFKDVDFNRRAYGPGYWKCNVSLLKDPKLKAEIENVYGTPNVLLSLKMATGGKSVKVTFKIQL